MNVIRGVLNTLQDCRVCHVKMEANAVTHGLWVAKVAVKQIMDQVWIEEIPNCITTCSLFLIINEVKIY